MITCTAYGPAGPAVFLATTEDFTTVTRHGIIRQPEDKNAALLPHRIDGKWVLFHRPKTEFGGANGEILLSRSDDLVSWSTPEQVLRPRDGAWWDARGSGSARRRSRPSTAGCSSTTASRRWSAASIYRVGLALLDLDEPTRVLHRLPSWVLAPARRTNGSATCRTRVSVRPRPRCGDATRSGSTTARRTPRSASRPRGWPTCSRPFRAARVQVRPGRGSPGQDGRSWTSSSSTSFATSAARELTPSLANMRRKWVDTVHELMPRFAAIALFGNPSPTMSPISCSRGLSALCECAWLATSTTQRIPSTSTIDDHRQVADGHGARARELIDQPTGAGPRDEAPSSGRQMQPCVFAVVHHGFTLVPQRSALQRKPQGCLIVKHGTSLGHATCDTRLSHERATFDRATSGS